MLIVADQNIPLAEEAFRQFGEVRLLPGREMTPADLEGAEALIVRSVTKAGPALLDGSGVRFVGTATIGTDHLDIPWLEQAGITWASAAGCNARSVVEYVLAALGEWSLKRGRDWQGMTLGIVGCGNIGGRLAELAPRVGLNVLRNDPPRERGGEQGPWTPLEELLAKSDAVTLHTPLSLEGPDATHHLIGAQQLALMKQDSLLVNASRGPVLDNKAVLDARADISLVLDVFEGEPAPDKALVERCFLATPHIAGYSYEGKVNGTRMMADALARHLEMENHWDPRLPEPWESYVGLLEEGLIEETVEAMRHCYEIAEDDRQLREGLELSPAVWAQHFDSLRRNYPERREFPNYTAQNLEDEAVAARLAALGFRLP